MARTKFYTTHPATGEVAMRTSENRTYTHAVWERKTGQKVHAEAARDLKYNAERLAMNQADVRDHGPDAMSSAKGWTYGKLVAHYTEQVDKLQALVDLGADGCPAGPWKVAGWCGRHDLATKLASTERSKGYEALVTEATTTKPADEDPAACGVCVHGKQQHEACADCEEVK
jgi:hypothetical protein